MGSQQCPAMQRDLKCCGQLHTLTSSWKALLADWFLCGQGPLGREHGSQGEGSSRGGTKTPHFHLQRVSVSSFACVGSSLISPTPEAGSGSWREWCPDYDIN